MTGLADRLPRIAGQLYRAGILRDLDVELVEAVARRCGGNPPAEAAWVAAALASRAVGAGHVCLDLDRLTPQGLRSLSPDPEADVAGLTEDVVALCGGLEADATRGAPGFWGPPESAALFVFEARRFYLRRYWEYEQGIAGRLRELARLAPAAGTGGDAAPDARQGNLTDSQQAAIHTALTRGLTIITGGPGTGKTYTAAHLLAQLLGRAGPGGAAAPAVRLAAPTGKAAAKLDASVREALRVLAGEAAARVESVPQAATVDRLLGYQPGSPYFRHDRDHPLPADVVIVDEASMLDVPKTAKLLDALSAGCRLVLLGDMHQLASVDPGSVMADLCSAGALSGCVVELTESRRFPAGSPVAILSDAINRADAPVAAGEAWDAFAGLDAESHGDCRILRREMPADLVRGDGAILPELACAVIDGFRTFTAARTPCEAFAALASFGILCALRRGPQGAETVNRLVTEILSGHGVSPDDLPPTLRSWTRLRAEGEFYDHRVIMVTRNDYGMNLFNGDIGVVLPDDEDPSRLVAWFPAPASPGNPDAPDLRKISCRLLPEHETAFAITVHKAQGSEYGRILLLLPARDSPVLTRELVYTAITRTRTGAEIWCTQSVFEAAVGRTVDRFTGLLPALGR